MWEQEKPLLPELYVTVPAVCGKHAGFERVPRRTDTGAVAERRTSVLGVLERSNYLPAY